MKRFLVTAVVVAAAAFAPAAWATGNATFSLPSGALTVTSDAADALSVDCLGGNVHVLAGATDVSPMPGGLPVSCSLVLSIVVTGGPGANSIDLTGVTPLDFPGVASLSADGADAGDIYYVGPDVPAATTIADTGTTAGQFDSLVVYGTAGNDTMAATDTQVGRAAGDAVGHSGIELFELQGQGGNDTLSASALTSAGAFLAGGAGDDVLTGGAGQDTFGVTPGHDVVTDTRGGEDELAFFDAPAAITIDLRLQAGQVQAVDAAGDTVQITSGSAIEDVFGSPFGDTITGDGAANFLSGGAGSASVDTIRGGAGTDSLFVFKGQANLDGEGDADTYGVEFGGPTGPVTIDDTGTSGSDELTLTPFDCSGVIQTASRITRSGETVDFTGIETVMPDCSGGGPGTGSISGRKFVDTDGDGVADAGEPGFPGVVIFLDANGNGLLDGGETSTTSGADGSYAFSGLSAGTYTVREGVSPSMVQSTPNPADVVLAAGGTATGVDFGNFFLALIRGTKFADTNSNGIRDGGEPGLGGWTIFLDANGNDLLDAGERSATTDSSGDYFLIDLGPGTYRVREVAQAGCTQTTPNPAPITPASGQNVAGVDFGNACGATITGGKFEDADVSGSRDAGEAGLAGWTIFLDANGNGLLDAGESSALTGASGDYSFTGLSAGTYTVREVSQAGWTRTTEDPAPFTLAAGAVRTNVDFGNVQLPAYPGAGPRAIVDLPGCWARALRRNDDGSTARIPIGFTLNFFGVEYDSLFVNNNGNVTFTGSLSSYTPNPIGSGSPPIIAPFWADVDTRASASGVTLFGPTTYNGRQALCVLWPGVGYYSQHTDKVNSFQLLIVDRSDTGAGNFDVVFNYDQVQWETGDASSGQGGLGGSSVRAGYSNGAGTSFELPGSAVNGALLDSNAATALIANSIGSLQLGRYVFPVRNGVAPAGGTIFGFVTDELTPPNDLAGASVSVCRRGGGCQWRLTNSAGRYAASGLADGDYDVGVFPPASRPELSTELVSLTLSGGATVQQDVVLRGPRPIPPDTSISTPSRGTAGAGATTPTTYWGDPIRVDANGCVGGTATATMAIDDGGAPVITPMTETPPGSGHYTGTLPAPFPRHGNATISIAIACPGGVADNRAFEIYIDPSGKVVDQTGAPVTGATVTLLRSDAETGPFETVPDGSPIMSPANRTNPQTTDADGLFGWDVMAGFYLVRAQKAGCTSAETAVLTIPPPVTNLVLTLTCATPSGGGGGAVTTTPARPQPPTPTPPRVGHAGPPRVLVVGGAALPPLRARPSGDRAFVTTRISVDEPAVLRIRVFEPRRARTIPLERGSSVAGVRTGRRRQAIVYDLAEARQLRLRLSMQRTQLVPGRLYRIEVAATDRDGQSTTIAIAFRG